eukprot:4683138-Pyramimonas_sp.AAC.1
MTKRTARTHAPQPTRKYIAPALWLPKVSGRFPPNYAVEDTCASESHAQRISECAYVTPTSSSIV